MDDLEFLRRALATPGPRPEVVAAGRSRLGELLGTKTNGPNEWGRFLRRPRLPLIGAAAVLAAAVAVAAVVVVPRLAGHPKATSAAAPPKAPVSIQKAVLTAEQSATGDVMTVKETKTGYPASYGGVFRYVAYPAQPSPGQQVRVYESFSATGDWEDLTYTEGKTPEIDNYGGGAKAPLRGTVVAVHPGTKTWFREVDMPMPKVPEQVLAFLLNKSQLLASHVVAGHATVDGRPAIELTSVQSGSGIRERVWVDAGTYLPLREEELGWIPGEPDSEELFDFQFLAASAATVAKAEPPVPSDYTQASG